MAIILHERAGTAHTKYGNRRSEQVVPSLSIDVIILCFTFVELVLLVAHDIVGYRPAQFPGSPVINDQTTLETCRGRKEWKNRTKKTSNQ